MEDANESLKSAMERDCDQIARFLKEHTKMR
jgi:hypothetical protein